MTSFTLGSGLASLPFRAGPRLPLTLFGVAGPGLPLPFFLDRAWPSFLLLAGPGLPILPPRRDLETPILPSFTLGSGLALLPFMAGPHLSLLSLFGSGPGLPLPFLLGCAEFPSSFVGVVLIVQLASKIKETLTNEEKKRSNKEGPTPTLRRKGQPQLGRADPNLEKEGPIPTPRK